ncbi:MAG: sigma-70 family RNA polymerase sigma factor [Bacteroidetes bacterium]|nr:sigma-70 family RNA polymerase sigma factor [Bacteroidota bacterium]
MLHTEKLINRMMKKLRKISKDFSPQQIDDAHSKAIELWLTNSSPQKNEDWCIHRIEQWLFTTALRILLYESKKRKFLLFVPLQLKGKKNENEDFWAYIPHPDSTQDSLCEDIEVLPEIYKVVMILHYIEGYSLEEIAVKTDCTSAAIRQRHKRALAMLRKILGVPSTKRAKKPKNQT